MSHEGVISQRALTHAEVRALEGASRLAPAAGRAAVERDHLLWVFALDETRATDRVHNGIPVLCLTSM